jgi:hypothetical protein
MLLEAMAPKLLYGSKVLTTMLAHVSNRQRLPVIKLR